MSDDNDGVQKSPEITPTPSQVVEDVTRRQVHQMMFGFQVSQNAPNTALVEKFQPEHVSKVLDSAEKESQRNHSSNRIYFIGGLVGAFAICCLLLYFQQSSLVQQALAALLGFAGGYGYGRSKK